MTDGHVIKRTTRSEVTRALMKERALANGKNRSAEVQNRVRNMMKAIEKEIEDNNGIYPRNKGALSSAELARRAVVHPTTFFGSKQRQLGTEVKNWLESIKRRKVVGRGAVRRELTTRIGDWEALCEGLKQSQRDTELALQQTEAELADALEDLEKARRDNQRLQNLLANAGDEKVVPLRSRKT